MIGSKIDIEQDYFHWLCEQVGMEHGGRSYWILAGELHKRIFVPFVEHDENRESDGMELRDEYLCDCGFTNCYRFNEECSMLEMLIALAREMDFETGDVYVQNGNDNRTDIWFWELIENLGLEEFDDASYGELGGQAYVNGIIDRLLDREYDADGHGGLFPLKHPIEDQRYVEIWYQMAAYLNEREEY